jgi:hypothetical protein
MGFNLSAWDLKKDASRVSGSSVWVLIGAGAVHPNTAIRIKKAKMTMDIARFINGSVPVF